jgi:radical SAM protein with 4Fe4S-binding SPASM domain
MLRYWLYRLRFRLREWIPGRFPIHLDLELAGRCQLACTMCPYGEGTFDDSKQGMMPPDIAWSALRQAREGGALSVKLNFRGEPGLCSYLSDAVAWAKELGFVEVIINTNLTAFSKRRLKELILAGLDRMIVSVDGATKETYEAIRIKGDFYKLIENLCILNTYRMRWRVNKPRLCLQMTVQDQNRHEMELMRKTFSRFSDEIQFNPVRSDNAGKRKKCPQPWQRLVVMWDGQVGACCSNWNNEAVIGEFPKQNLLEIWESRTRKQLLHFAADPNRGGPCKGCLVGGSYR